MGSSTHRVMVYNPNANAVNIDQVSIQHGDYFYINLDGENNIDNLRNIAIRGGDSLFLFVRANIDPQDENSPVLIEDKIMEKELYLRALQNRRRITKSKT